MRFFRLVCLSNWFLCLALLLGISVSSRADVPAHSQKITVGAVLTLSGPFASAGEDCRRGIEAGLSVAPSPLEFVYADSRNDPTTSILEFQKLVSIDKALAIYSHRSSIGMALDPISFRAEVPFLGAVGHQDFAQSNKYALQVWPRSDDEGRFLAETFIKRGHNKAALIYTEDEWTSSTSAGFRKRFLDLGGKLVFDQAVLPSETDFRTSLLKMKSAVPDAIYANMLLPQLSPVLRARKDFGVQGIVYSNFYVAKKDVVDSAGDALDDVRYTTLDSELPALKARLDPDRVSKPPGLTVASYVATLLLAQAVSTHPNAKTIKALYEALVAQTEVRTPDYVYPIRERLVRFPLVIEMMRGGKAHREADVP